MAFIETCSPKKSGSVFFHHALSLDRKYTSTGVSFWYILTTFYHSKYPHRMSAWVDSFWFCGAYLYSEILVFSKFRIRICSLYSCKIPHMGREFFCFVSKYHILSWTSNSHFTIFVWNSDYVFCTRWLSVIAHSEKTIHIDRGIDS